MGNIHLQPLATLATVLAKQNNIKEFVETGTFLGSSLSWASREFERVWTIELKPEYQAQAIANNSKLENVTYFLGDSVNELPKVIRKLKGPALFWLDAHAGAGFFANDDICPLLSEIESILDAPHDHYMIIDDARAFLAPPPPPFDYLKWPTLDQIFAVVSKWPELHIVTITDALIIVPKHSRELVAQFCFAIRPTI
jgi:hypothetical protein